MMKQTTKNHLLGCLDTMLFMPRPDTRFSGSYHDMLGSFVVLVLLCPALIIGALVAPHPAFAEQSQNVISLTYSVRFCIALGIFVGFVYFLSQKTDRTEHFFRFITAYNWLTVPIVLLSLPVTFMVASPDPHTAHQGLVLSYFLLAYSFAITAYLAACTLRIPVELAAFIVIVGIQINNSSYKFVDWVGTMLS